MTMLRIYLSLFVSVFALTFFASCQKDVKPTDEEIDDIVKQLPQQIFYAEPDDDFFEAWSLQYDTLNRKINVYLDDTTNSNPYDALKHSYEYNTSGYLVKYSRYDEDDPTPLISVIERDASNRIKYITNHDMFIGENDSSFYKYEAVGDNLTTIVSRKSRSGGRFNDTYTYKGQLLQSFRPDDMDFQYDYIYNQQKLTSMGYGGDGEKYSFSFTYGSGQPDRKADHLLELVLGKDHYLQDIRDFYFFFLFKDRKYITVSASDPHHPTVLVDQYETDNGGVEWSDTRTYSYQFNEQQLPVLITGQFESFRSIYTIRY